jgi:3-oxoacyl-[acyl-carrier protein] reductase
VLIADLDGASAEAAAGRLADLPGSAIGVAFDATDPAAHDKLAALAVDHHGGPDVWVNKAGIYPFTGLLDPDDAEWRRVLSLNLDGFLWGCRPRAARCGTPTVAASST